MCAVSWTMMWPKASVVRSTETPLARYSVRFMFVSSDCVSQILVRRAQSFSSGGFGRLAGGTMPLGNRGIDYSATQSLPPLRISRARPADSLFDFKKILLLSGASLGRRGFGV